MHLREFRRSGHLPTLLSAFLYFDVSFMAWVMLGPVATFIGEQLHLSATQKGLVTALPLLGGSVFRLVLGAITDRVGGKRAGQAGMTITLLPLMIGWLFAHSLPAIYLMGLLLGVAGASFAAALPLASRWYPPEHQGLALGIAGAGNSGTVLATLFAPRMARAMGWHAVFGLAMIPIVLVLALFTLLARDSPSQPPPQRLSDFLSVFREPDAWSLCAFYGVTFGGFVGLASFLSVFFHDQYGLSKVQAGDFTTLCVIAGSFLRPVGGYLADRFGGIEMLLGLYLAVALLLLAAAALPPLGAVTMLLFLVMACLGMGNGSVFQLVPQRFGRQIGAVTGIVGAAGGLGGFFLPVALGALKDRFGTYGAGFLLFAGVAAVCAAGIAAVRPRWLRTWLGAVDLAREGA